MPPKGNRLFTDIITVNPAPRAAGAYEFTAPSPIPSGLTQAAFTVLLSTPDKLAVGKTFTWSFSLSSDGGSTWEPAGAGGWASYGPGGLTAPDGASNPDPVLIVSLVNRDGQRLRGTIVLASAFTAGVEIAVA